jgi:hypothetical protein
MPEKQDRHNSHALGEYVFSPLSVPCRHDSQASTAACDVNEHAKQASQAGFLRILSV